MNETIRPKERRSLLETMKIAIIGAGASGMMVAVTLAELGISGESIALFDGNTSIGKKVAITGGGRCNVTTGIVSKKELLAKYVRGADFIETAMGKFSPKKVREWFLEHGCPLKVEDDFRVFPVSDRSSDVIGVFSRILENAGIRQHLATKVLSVKREEGASQGFLVETLGGVEHFDVLVVATGGEAYAKTGSSGSGYSFAQALRHTVTPLAPSLSAFSV